MAGTFSGVNGKIAYINGSSLHPYSMNADGTGQTELASVSTDRISYSPDGTRITYAGPNGASHIFVANADGSDPVQITSGSALDTEPTWSADGSKITYLSFRSGTDPYDLVYNINPDGTGKALLADVGTSPSGLTYSPDGTKIAYTASLGGGGNDIYVMDADGSHQTAIIATSEHEADPRWSPDGTKIVYDRFDGTDYDIYVADADGSNRTQLTNNSVSEFNPVFSPDGTKIAYARYAGAMDTYTIYEMNADGSDQTQVSSTITDNYVDWQPLTLAPTTSDANPTITVSDGTASVNIPSLYSDPYGGGIDAGTVSVTSSPSYGTTSVNSSTGVITYTQSGVASASSLWSKLADLVFPKTYAAASTDSFGYRVCSSTSGSLCSTGTVTVNLASGTATASSASAPNTGYGQPAGAQVAAVLAIGAIVSAGAGLLTLKRTGGNYHGSRE